ncbi:MAG: hypothetical protein EHM63_02030 [Actinobacteria bacterium]|nr:MAG: hypothetical protein EHM63_02030 [Actinomycetota bacterium]
MALNDESIFEGLADGVVNSAVAVSSKKRPIAVAVIILAVVAAVFLVKRSRMQAAEELAEEPASVAA